MPPARAAGRRWPGMALLSATVLALAALLLWSAEHGHLPQFQGKAMEIRLVFVPLAALVVPASWWLARYCCQRRLAFPFTPAVLVVLALLIDLVGNATRLYDTVEHFDDAVHAVNPVLLVAAVAVVLRPAGLPRWASWVMAFGTGCAGNIVWELAEYAVMTRLGADGLALFLPDTLSDQAWGVLGAAVGATVPLLLSSAASDQASAPEARRAPVRVAATADLSLVFTAPR